MGSKTSGTFELGWRPRCCAVKSRPSKHALVLGQDRKCGAQSTRAVTFSVICAVQGDSRCLRACARGLMHFGRSLCLGADDTLHCATPWPFGRSRTAPAPSSSLLNVSELCCVVRCRCPQDSGQRTPAHFRCGVSIGQVAGADSCIGPVAYSSRCAQQNTCESYPARRHRLEHPERTDWEVACGVLLREDSSAQGCTSFCSRAARVSNLVLGLARKQSKLATPVVVG